jgi:hypothetical protein
MAQSGRPWGALKADGRPGLRAARNKFWKAPPSHSHMHPRVGLKAGAMRGRARMACAAGRPHFSVAECGELPGMRARVWPDAACMGSRAQGS